MKEEANVLENYVRPEVLTHVPIRFETAQSWNNCGSGGSSGTPNPPYSGGHHSRHDRHDRHGRH